MATWKLKPHCGCLAWAVWLFLHSQQNQRLIGFAGDSNENVVGGPLPGDEEGLAGVGDQDFQHVSDEPATFEATPLLPRSSAGESGNLGVADEDGREALRGVVVEGARARIIRSTKTLLQIISLLVLLVTIVRVLVISGQAALQHSASPLRRLEALMPTVETLSVAVGTPESQRLWAAVEVLLPELRQTLSSAEAKVTERRFFLFGRIGGQYRDLMDRVHSNVEKVTEAIAALHRTARDQVEAMAKSLPGIKASEFATLEGQLGKAVGSEFARAFVMFVDAQEAQAGRILRAARLLVVRSYRMPIFVDERDKALLNATIHNIDQMKQLLSAREVVQRHIEEARKSCAEVLASTLRAELVAAAHYYRTLLKGMSIFFERPELQSEGDQLIRHGLEKKQVIHEGQGDDRLRVQKEASNLMEEAADYAGVMSRQAQDLMNEIKQRQAEVLGGSFCPNVVRTIDLLMERLHADAEENAKLCRQVADHLGGDDAVENLFGTLMEGLTKYSRVFKTVRGMQDVRGYVDLLQMIETDISSSLDIIIGVKVDNMDSESSSAKAIISAKDEVAKELAALEEVVALPRAAEGAARISEAALSAAFAQYEGIVSQLEQEHKAARPKARDSAKEQIESKDAAIR
ncbi:hypothetical protein Esti_002429 [Eimeria stiedai]